MPAISTNYPWFSRAGGTSNIRQRQQISMATVLDKIVAKKRAEIAAAKSAQPIEALRERLLDAPRVRPFFDALAADGPIKLIAEVKKASPSKGVIRHDFRPVEIAQIYAANGATCISVLTDEAFFQGSIEYLREIRKAVDVPLLRKDFILDSHQLVEARVAGADAVLLIAECLDDCDLRKLHNEAVELGMTPLVEFYEPANLGRVIDAGATLIGINNRDLKTFETDLQHTVRLRKQIPDDYVVVGESGIHRPADVKMLSDADVDAILVGESLMAQPDIAQAVKSLLSEVT